MRDHACSAKTLCYPRWPLRLDLAFCAQVPNTGTQHTGYHSPPPALLMEKAMTDAYKIKVIKADTGEVVKTLEAVTERRRTH